MSYLWHDDPSAPCGRCGAARNCEHRTVRAHVAPVARVLPIGAHHKKMHEKMKVGNERKTVRDDKPYAVNGNLIGKRS